MPKRLQKIQRTFIALQCVILLCSLGSAIFFIHINYAKKSFALWKQEFDKTAHLLVDQIRFSKDVPFNKVGHYILFIIHEKDGSYVVPRQSSSEKDEKLWRSYQTKLIYQMQKQKQGWITYPEGGDPPQFGSRMIRYLYIEELGWIVAVEAVIDARTRLLELIDGKRLGIQLLLILLIGLFFFRWLTHYNFSLMKTIIAEHMENSFMHLSNEGVWGGKSEDNDIQEKVRHTFFAETSAEISESSVEEPMPDLTTSPVKEIEEFHHPAEEQKEEKTILAENIEKEKKLSIRPVFENTDIDAPMESSAFFSESVSQPQQVTSHLQEDQEWKNNPSQEESHDLKLDLHRIQSPVLKRMIKALREKR